MAVPGLSCPETCRVVVPRPGIEPVCPALADGFLTTGPPVKSLNCLGLILTGPLTTNYFQQVT